MLLGHRRGTPSPLTAAQRRSQRRLTREDNRLLELKCHACFLTICMYMYMYTYIYIYIYIHIYINMLIILHAMIMCVLWHMTSSGYSSIKYKTNKHKYKT